MNQFRFRNVSFILVGAALVASCSSDDSEVPTPSAPGAPSAPSAPTDMSVPPMNESATPSPMEGEAQSNETPAPTVPLEGQPENVGLAPSSMTGPEPVEPPAPMEMESEPVADGAPVPSAGCGSSAAVQSGRFNINAAGASREYILELPQNYDANRPYRLIFGWHWRGGSAADVANDFYGMQPISEGSAIFVSPQGIDAGWANPDGRDLAFLDAMLERFEGELCIDQSRIFSAGWSYGGMMSLAVGCARGDVFRAIAPMSGALYSGCEDSDASIAFLGFHGTADDVVPIANGRTARDVFVERNGCQPEQEAVQANGCLRYEGCATGSPVTWCEFNGGHTPAPGSGRAIWDFFSQF